MELVYDNSVDDIVEFTMHASSQSLVRMQRKCALYIFIPVMLASLFACRNAALLTRVIIVLVFFVTASVVAGIYCAIVPLIMRRTIRRTLSADAHPGIVGRHRLIFDDAGIIEYSDVGESRQPWTAVQRVVETDRHAYIYVSPLSGHVIPREAIDSAALNELLQWMRDKCPTAAFVSNRKNPT